MRPHVLGAVIAVLVALQPACRQEAPVPQQALPSRAAPSNPVPLGETFQLSQPRFQYEESHLLSITYGVHHRGHTRERSYLCVDFLDKDGYLLVRNRAMGRLSLREDQSVQARGMTSIAPAIWRDTQVLRVYVASPLCSNQAPDQRSGALFVDKDGHPLPAAERPEEKPIPGIGSEPPGSSFRLEDMRVSQDARGDLWVDYKVTNLAKARATGQLCARLTEESSCPCRSLDHAEEIQDVNLGGGASERRRANLFVRDITKWGRGRSITFCLGVLSCTTPMEQALSNVLTIPKPPFIHAPVE